MHTQPWKTDRPKTKGPVRTMRARRRSSDAALTGPDPQAPCAGGAEAALDDVRMNKVEQLRVQIESGRYEVSTEALAEKLIERMRGGGGV